MPSSTLPAASTPATSTAHLGIDIAKATFQAALLLPDGRLLDKASLPNTPAGFTQLRQWVDKHAVAMPVHAVMEATGTCYEELALHMHGWVTTLSVVNPRQIKAYADTTLRRTKTDAVDARLIARFAAAQKPAAWLPPTPAQRELQELNRRLQSLIATRTAEKVRLSCVRTARVRESLERHLEALADEITQVEAAIAQVIRTDSDLSAREKLLRSIPGIGATTAARLLGEIGDIGRYDNARALGAHGGLTPRREQSGSSINRRGGICRIGSSRLRSALYFPAMTAMERNPLLITFARRLREAGKAPKLIITAVMRKLLHIVFGVLKSNQPFNPQILNQTR